ncbi:MAG: ATP-binding protein [Candidatus Methylomirabilales bacterium]
MNEVLKSLVQAFEGMAEAYQLVAERLGRQLDRLETAHADLKEYAQQLEAKAHQLASSNRDLTHLVADLEIRAGELEAQREVLSRQDQLKTDFLATVAHEFRTPLTAMKGALSLLLHEEPSDPETRESFLVLAHQNVERLVRLIGNYFNLARIETGRLVLDRQGIELGDFLQTVIGRMQGPAQERRIHIDYQGPRRSVQVLGDPEVLESVLVNLLDNAIKFSPEGTRVQVSLEMGPTEAIVQVSDQGVGIPPDGLPRVFERFYRREVPGVRATGSGLGLHICKAIVEGHGGRIWVESEVGRGSTFRFTLPLESQP